MIFEERQFRSFFLIMRMFSNLKCNPEWFIKCTESQIQSPAVATPSVFILFATHSGIFSAISAHFSSASMMVNTFRLESTIFKQKVFRCVFTNFIFIMTWLRAGLNMRAQISLYENNECKGKTEPTECIEDCAFEFLIIFVHFRTHRRFECHY